MCRLTDDHFRGALQHRVVRSYHCYPCMITDHRYSQIHGYGGRDVEVIRRLCDGGK